ncbi:hypothetical protein C8R47DRAFT_120048 [Mycena vitilis]|nr:hypothetical protein C8R47DRAFT_120048 [Mycena vitilis]
MLNILTPWLNFQPIRNSKNPLVDIACSAVAARHLDGEAGREIRVRLQTLARDSIAQMIFSPSAPDSTEAVQCLLILSLWGPFGTSTDTQGWDPRSLISTAVRMALNLRLNHASTMPQPCLNHASTMANDTRKREVNPITSNIADSETSERARLWIALTNADSLLCLGTRCAPSSRRSTEDIRFVEFPRVYTARPDVQNLRLGLAARQFDLYEEGTAMCLGSKQEEWAQDIKNVLEQMKREKRLLAPLPVILDTEQFHFHAPIFRKKRAAFSRYTTLSGRRAAPSHRFLSAGRGTPNLWPAPASATSSIGRARHASSPRLLPLCTSGDPYAYAHSTRHIFQHHRPGCSVPHRREVPGATRWRARAQAHAPRCKRPYPCADYRDTAARGVRTGACRAQVRADRAEHGWQVKCAGFIQVGATEITTNPSGQFFCRSSCGLEPYPANKCQ